MAFEGDLSQSYLKGFDRRFEQTSPFTTAAEQIKGNLDVMQTQKAQNEETKNKMYGAIPMPQGTQMYGSDFAKAQEMVDYLKKEGTIKEFASSPEKQREYQGLVSELKQFVGDATEYYKTTYGTEVNPKQGTYLGSSARSSTPNFFEKDGYSDTRTDYDDLLAVMNTPDHRKGTVGAEGGSFIFDDLQGNSRSLSESDFKSIDVFMPNLSKVAYTTPEELIGSTPWISNAKNKVAAQAATLNYVASKPVLVNSALQHYNEVNNSNVSKEDMEMEDVYKDVMSTYAEAAADQWKAKQTASSRGSSSTTKAPVTFGQAKPFENGEMVSFPKAIRVGADYISGVIKTPDGWVLMSPVKGEEPMAYVVEGDVEKIKGTIGGALVVKATTGMREEFGAALAKAFNYPSAESALAELTNGFGQEATQPASKGGAMSKY